MVGKVPCVIVKGKQQCNLFPIPENICSNHIDKSSLVWYTLDTMSRRTPNPDKYATPYTCRSVLLAVMETANEEFGRKKIKQRIRAGRIIRLLMRFLISDGWEWCLMKGVWQIL